MHRHLIHPLDFNPRSNAKSDPLFDSPSSNDDDSNQIMSLASLDKRKYDWYPNRCIDSPISTITVSPTPKKFCLPEFQRLLLIEDDPAFSSAAPKFFQSKHASFVVKNFDAVESNVDQTKSSNKGGAQLSQALRRHTVILLHPISERHEEMDCTN